MVIEPINVSKPADVADKVISLAELDYPNLVAYLMQAGIPWTGSGEVETGWELMPLMMAYWIKEFGLGTEVPKVPLPKLVYENFEHSYEKHLFNVQKMLMENKDKFPGFVFPVATQQKSVIVIDKFLNAYKVLFDDKYEIVDIEQQKFYDSIGESVGAFVKELVNDHKFNKTLLDQILASRTEEINKSTIDNYLSSLDRSLYRKFYNDNKETLRKAIRGELADCIFNKPKDNKKGMIKLQDSLKQMLNSIEQSYEALQVNRELTIDESIGISYLRDVINALREDVEKAIELMELNVNEIYKNKLYNILVDRYEEFKVGEKWLARVTSEVK